MLSCPTDIASGQKRETFLGAHLMNDPRFGLPPKVNKNDKSNDVISEKKTRPLVILMTR